MRFGTLEKGVFMYVSGMLPFGILIYINSIVVFTEGEMIPFWYSIMMIMGVFISFMGLIWVVLKVRGNRAYILTDDTAPEEIVIIRVTNDGVVVPTVAPKGTYGKAETLCYGEDADFMDDGASRLRLINGSPVIITYDLLNNAIDLRRSMTRKIWKRHVENGTEAYKRGKILNWGKKDKYEVDDDGEKETKEN